MNKQNDNNNISHMSHQYRWAKQYKLNKKELKDYDN